MDPADAPIDVERLSKPEADAFRTIAAALGARFAGDPAPAAEPPATIPPPRRLAPALADDPRAAALLDRVPVPALVVDGDAIAFMNRAAHVALGYRSAAALDAAGGLGALFRRGGADAGPGTVAIATASGATLSARATMSAVDWGGGRAMLVTLEPKDAASERPATAAGELLARLLDANPDPVAIVTRSGTVEASNAAFERLAPGGRTLRLDGHLAPADVHAVHAAIARAFCLTDGVAEPPAPVALGDALYRVTAGPLPGGALACLVLHPLGAAGQRPLAPPAGPQKSALERAADDVRRLVDEAAVLIILDGAPGEEGEDAVRFWRSLFLAVAARADVGSVLDVRHDGGSTLLRLAPRTTLPFDRALASFRIADLAAAAGLALGIDGEALAVRPARTAAVTHLDVHR